MNYEEFNNLYGFEEKAGFKLSPLQVQDIETFLTWRKSLNRYQVGGGKTVVSTVVSLMTDVELTLVIVPPILLLPWERWLNQVSSSVLRYQGTPVERGAMKPRNYRWVICSHAIFRKDFQHLHPLLKTKKLDIIMDEAQAMKSPASLIFKRVLEMSCNQRLQMLTGTPTSTPLDCYTYIKIKSPEIYRSFGNFEQCHVAERDFFGAVKSYQNLDVLAERFAIKSIQRTKEELHGYDKHAIFPDCTYELDKEHSKLYEKLLEERLLLLDDGSKIDGTTATKLYHLMQQIIVNWDHFSGDPTKKSKAYDLIDQTIESTDCLVEGNSKLIVWTYYKMTSRNVLKYLRDRKVYAVGAYSEVDSAKSFDLFMNDPKCRVGVFQPSSAGAGLNPQAVCWETLNVELSTTPMLSRQSIGRVERLGQKHIPTVRFGVAAGTVQVKLLDDLQNKDDLVSEVEFTKKSLREMMMGQIRK